MSISSTGLSDCEKHRRLATRDHGPRGPPATNQTNPRPLVVRPTIARKLLGNIGPDRLWRLLKAGELDSYLVGRSRFITVESIERYVARHLAEARDENGRVKLYDHNPAPAPRPAADAGSAKVPRKRRRNTDQTLRRPVAASPTQQREQQTPASAP